MSRMEKFEKVWADRHGVPAETLVQYRFDSKEGYRLPGMAAHFRTYCDTLDSITNEEIKEEVIRVIQAEKEKCLSSCEGVDMKFSECGQTFMWRRP